jgi:uncharacterized phage protein (TIGR01671 family)
MSRELKFRQGLFSFGKFYGWHYWGASDGEFKGPATSADCSINTAIKNSQQFTGLTDKNGKEIFEGDIVTYDTEDCLVTTQVVWKQEEAENSYWMSGFCYEIIKTDDIPDDDEGHFEVIGNIYENPALVPLPK